MSELIFESYSGMILFWFFPLFVNFFCFSFENIGEENFAKSTFLFEGKISFSKHDICLQRRSRNLDIEQVNFLLEGFLLDFSSFNHFFILPLEKSLGK